MPNHVHLLYFAGGKQTLNTVMGNGKRFIGYEVVKRLQQQNDVATLQVLSAAVSDVERKRGKQHQPWQGTFDAKECRTENFVLQKLNYMHHNPCTERWQLSKQSFDYLHSSAAFYELGQKEKGFLRDYREYLSLVQPWEVNNCG